MKYYKAELILPDQLLAEIRAYVPEGMLYISKPDKPRRRWGELSGARARIDRRNAQIRARHKRKESVEHLAETYHLSVESIKRIVYRK